MVNKRGSAADLLLIVIGFFAVVIIFALFIYMLNQVASPLESLGVVGERNVSADAITIFGPMKVGFGMLRFIAVGIFFGMVLGVMISNFFIKAHPVFFAAYVMFSIGAIAVSALISNQYDTIVATGILDNTLNSFGAANFILAYFPTFITAVALLGAILLYVNLTRDQATELSLT